MKTNDLIPRDLTMICRTLRHTAVAAMVLVLAACSAIPEKPVRPSVYDFGPGPLAAPASRATLLTPIVLMEVDVAAALDNAFLNYRLAYADAQQLRPYALARWSMPPGQLVRQRLVAALGQQRAVLGPDDRTVVNKADGAWPLVMRVELEEFSQLFEAPDRSAGLVRLRATVLEASATGERFMWQRSVVVQRPASTLDAPGGARAMAAATDAAVEEIAQWLRQLR
jgi:cholesterol transport system auxiliary component